LIDVFCHFNKQILLLSDPLLSFCINFNDFSNSFKKLFFFPQKLIFFLFMFDLSRINSFPIIIEQLDQIFLWSIGNKLTKPIKLISCGFS